MAKASIQVVELPEEFRNRLLEELMPDPVRALLQALEAEKQPPPEGPQYQDFCGLLEVLDKELVQELFLFTSIVGIRRFQARTLTYKKTTRKKSVQWELADVGYAAPRVLNDGARGLRELMEASLLENEGEVCLWVTNASPTDDRPLFVVVARHRGGLEQAYLLRERHWVRMPLADEQRETVLQTLCAGSGRDTERWRQIAMEEADALAKAFAPAVKEASASLPALTPEQLRSVARLMLGSNERIALQRDVARVSATACVRESHRLLEATTKALVQSLEMGKDKLAQAEKDHERSVRRLRNDLSKLQMSLDGITRRTKQVDAENQALKKAQRQGGIAAPIAARETVSVLMERLFVFDADAA